MNFRINEIDYIGKSVICELKPDSDIGEDSNYQHSVPEGYDAYYGDIVAEAGSVPQQNKGLLDFRMPLLNSSFGKPILVSMDNIPFQVKPFDMMFFKKLSTYEAYTTQKFFFNGFLLRQKGKE